MTLRDKRLEPHELAPLAVYLASRDATVMMGQPINIETKDPFSMNALAYGFSVLIIVSGALFAAQGLSLMPSRVMYGRPEWVVIGGAMVLAGAALIVFTLLRGARRHR